MKLSVFVFAITMLGMPTMKGLGQRFLIPGEIRYAIRVLNFTGLDWTGESYLKDLKWTVRNTQPYVSGKALARRTYIIRRVFVQFERCRDFEFSCEDFQTWNASDEICLFFRLKNQVWSDWIESMDLKRFPQTCPRIEKGTYEIRNFTFDPTWVTMFYSDAPKYFWKIHVFFYNDKKEIEYQNHGHGHIISYIKRKKTAILHP